MSRDIYELKNKRKSEKRKQQAHSPSSDYHSEKKKVGRWTEEEDLKLQKLIEEYGEKSWRIISDMMEGRSAIQCLHRWTKILKPGLRKGPWQEEEDEKLLQWVKCNGPCKWSLCAENIAGRSGKQCRERWFNNLNPNVKKGGWTSDEDREIFRGYLHHSSSWSKIAKNLLGRTENSVKNRFYSTVRKLLADQEKKGGLTGLSIKQMELENQNGTSVLQSFIREQLAKFQPGLSLNLPQQEDDQEEIEQEEEPELFQQEQDQNQMHQSCQQHDMKQEELLSKSYSGEEESKSRKKQMSEGYPEQNLLYRLLKEQGGPIKRTSCMKDYSTIYKKYKKRYNQKKKDKKLSDKVENLRKLILKKDDVQGPNEVKEEIQMQINNMECQFAQFQQAKLEASHNGDQDKMNEFQDKLLAFFNQQLNEVMKKFYQDVGDESKKQQKWQMILAPEDAKIVYPQNFLQNFSNIQQTPIQMQQQQQQQSSQQLQQQPQQVDPKKKGKRSQSKIKKEDDSDQNAQVMTNFLQKFSHLGQIGIAYATINEGQPETHGDNQMVQDTKIDQKMMFLISQLHTLENMLGDTKKEFSRLEASLYDKINNNNNSYHSNNSSERN